MCGIFGVIGRQDPGLLKKMDSVLFHRGPDSSGAINFEDASIGARRLSIIDLQTGDQPIHNEDKGLWVAQNGEIYNYPELRSELITKGHKFYTHSDTEVIVHAYEEYGDSCVRHFNGMFAFVIWDTKRKRLFAARDRAGIKPFFYWQQGNVLLFASEIKAILQDDSFRREMDITAFYNYLGRLFVPGDRTIYEGIKKLPPGHTLIFEKGKLAIDQYWDIDLKKKVFFEDAEYERSIRQKLENSVKRQLISDVPVGAFLSGGIDSNGVVAFMAKNSSIPVRTFTMGYTGNDEGLTNETAFARGSAGYFGTDHKEFIVDPTEIIADLPKITWFFDQPYAGSLPQYQLSKLAGKHVKVVLCGLGGDELFGDYGRGMRLAQSFGRLSRMFLYAPRFVKNALIQFNRRIPGAWKQKGVSGYFFEYLIKTLEIGKLYARQQAIFSETAKKQLLKESVFEKIDLRATFEELFLDFLVKSRIRIAEDIVAYADFKTQLADEYLCYTDTLSMAHSLESRVPFLDNELIDYASTIPIRRLVKGDDPKYLLKRSLKPVLPPGTTERRKGYFSLPYGMWLRNELRNWVSNALSRERIESLGYFSYEKVQEIVNDQRAGDDSKTYQVWNLLMFSLWHEMFMERKISNISEAGIGVPFAYEKN